MRRSVKFDFRSCAVVTDITGNIPGWCRHRLPYALAERIVIREGTIISQYYSHFLFFIEVIEMDLKADLEADYVMDEISLFLFMMLAGNITFHTPDVEQVAEAAGNTCYATYNRDGKFSFRLPAGRHRLCYIVPRAEWIVKNIRYYPRLKPFLDIMQNGEALFGHMPSCTIGKGMELSLLKLFGRDEMGGKDFEAALLRDAKRVIYHYQKLLDARFSQRVYLIKDYLDKNFADPLLSNNVPAEVFHTTTKTINRDFKKEFNITPGAYLIRVRMLKAKDLLSERVPVGSVYPQVGYTDLRSFSKQFKQFFGFPPSEHN